VTGPRTTELYIHCPYIFTKRFLINKLIVGTILLYFFSGNLVRCSPSAWDTKFRSIYWADTRLFRKLLHCGIQRNMVRSGSTNGYLEIFLNIRKLSEYWECPRVTPKMQVESLPEMLVQYYQASRRYFHRLRKPKSHTVCLH
jgi:hypothetical protein